MLRPPVILLRDGGDTAQGRAHVLTNIAACEAVADVLSTTLGPRGMDKLIVGADGKTTITNDGATIVRLLDVVHPAARVMVDVARAQDAQVGDGTTSVVVLAGELLRLARPFIEDGVAPQVIVRGYRRALDEALGALDAIAVPPASLVPGAANQSEARRVFLQRCAATAMNSKLISAQQDFFSSMVVDAQLAVSPDAAAETDEAYSSDDNGARLVGVKQVAGGGLQDTLLVHGVAFERTFTYAGAEQQPKRLDDAPVLLLALELELKAERDNAEVRVSTVEEYRRVVDAEWALLFGKLDAIANSGARIVFSRLPIGDVATQFFAERGVYAAGRVSDDDLARAAAATGAPPAPHASVSDLAPRHLGRAGRFEERQVGDKRYLFLTQCPGARTATIVLRGGSAQFLAEAERSLHDALMVVRRAARARAVVGGAGATEMELALRLRDAARLVPGKAQLAMLAYAHGLEALPRALCDNAGIDATDALTVLRKRHAAGERWAGIVLGAGDDSALPVADALAGARPVWEPAELKANVLAAATEAACAVLSVDMTVKPAPRNERPLESALPGQHAH